MNKTRITGFAFLFVLSLLFSPYSADAGGTIVKGAYAARVKKQELLCQQLQDKIKNKQDTRKLVKTSIQMGYDACEVIKCAIKGGGELKPVIYGAIDAGATKDVVSRCCVDAGADAREVAAILGSASDPGLCYILPEEPPVIDPPPSGGHGGFLSPSGF